MNLSSFAIGAFLSHAAKSHGDMGGTKHLHYRRLSSAGLFLVSSLLLAPTVAQDVDRTVTFSTRIGNCDVDDDLFTFPPSFPFPLEERCLAAQDQTVTFGSPVFFAVPAPQVIPDSVDVFGDLGNDSEYGDGFTLEVEGPCAIDGLPNQLGECGLFLNAGGGFGQGLLVTQFGVYNSDDDITVEINDVGNDSNQLKDNYSICYVPDEDTEPGSTLPVATCTIKVSRAKSSDTARTLCLPPPDYGDNCLRNVGDRYFTQDERIDSNSALEKTCNTDGKCQLGRCECTRPACDLGCGPAGCGCPNGFEFGCCFLCGSQPFNPCEGECSESTIEEEIDCEVVTVRVPDGSTDTFTTVVEINTSGNRGECGDGFCIDGVDKNCRDCRRSKIFFPIAPEDDVS